MPVEQKVVAMFMAICPAFPIPLVTSFPYLSGFSHTAGHQLPFLTMYLFYNQVYRLLEGLSHRNIQNCLSFVLQQFVNG